MADVYVASLTDYSSRMNNPSPTPLKLPIEKFYKFAMTTGDFFVATLEKKIIALAGSTIRDNIWFLSAYWALPSYQKSGIGFPLVRRVYESGVKRNSEIFFVYASNDFPALVSYMKLGMYPGYPVFYFEGTPNFNINQQDEQDTFVVKDLKIEKVKELDKKTRGVDRTVDHGYWQSLDAKGYQIIKNSEIIGYFYNRNGFVGPLTLKFAHDTQRIIHLAFKIASNSNSDNKVSLMVPGINHQAIKYCFTLRLRMRSFGHFLTSKIFGQLENYIPSGAGLY
ncbi:MAG: GNAT family N-acetyltransferase [Candidatus Thorarchaeota archaeon]